MQMGSWSFLSTAPAQKETPRRDDDDDCCPPSRRRVPRKQPASDPRAAVRLEHHAQARRLHRPGLKQQPQYYSSIPTRHRRADTAA
eukprot:1160603-Pelagomonas_calceolata.AAC.1